jgi:DNA-binding transcriptional regulator YiaG
MGQVLHGSATTTHVVRAELQRSQASAAELARRFGINEKTVRKWRSSIEKPELFTRQPTHDMMGLNT